MKLHTSDGLDLAGWYVPSRNGAAVIVFPGRSGTRKQARMLARNGYGVLLYDRRGEGASEGDPNGWGWDFDKDILAGIDFLKDRPDVDPHRIGGLGPVGRCGDAAGDGRRDAATWPRSWPRAPAPGRWARRWTTSTASKRSGPR